MANRVSSLFELTFEADGTSTSVTWNLKNDPIIRSGCELFANNFSLANNLPTGFILEILNATGVLSGSNFTVTFSPAPPAGYIIVIVEFLW